MRYIPLLSALAVAALTACASSPSDEPTVRDGGPVQETTRVVGVQSSMDLRTNPTVSRTTVRVDGTASQVWSRLVRAYDSLGIPVTISNPPQGLLGNDGFKLRRRLKAAPLTRYLDCGNTQGGPSAETYEVLLTVKTQLVPVDGAITATTMVDASARPMAISGNYVKCASTGKLEERIGELLRGLPPTG